MQNTKMVIVVRKDLNMRKGKFASQVANASLRFLIENNESDRGDEFYVKMSPEESIWLRESMTRVIAMIDSESGLQDLIMKAEFRGIPVYSVFDSRVTPEKERILTCAAFGPVEGDDLSMILGKLKIVP
jgi:PTH2 family peptidyl-tRNA hydrolase